MSEEQAPYGNEKSNVVSQRSAVPDLRGLWMFEAESVRWSGTRCEHAGTLSGERVRIDQHENSFSFSVDRGAHARVRYVGTIRGATFTIQAEWNDADSRCQFDDFRTVNGGGEIYQNRLDGEYTLERRWHCGAGNSGACVSRVRFWLTRVDDH